MIRWRWGCTFEPPAPGSDPPSPTSWQNAEYLYLQRVAKRELCEAEDLNYGYHRN